ncbi:MAG: hypothetical protein F6K24_10035, partial [Okeania sp. SIO2D1]|nr:hypothetical protein [Okeania sp. SIO2D1]
SNRYNSLRPWNFFTQQVNNVLELAFDEAKHLNHREIGPVHLLLGLIRQEKGLAAQVLRSAGVKLENARLEVEKIQKRGTVSYNKDLDYDPYTKEILGFSQDEAEKLKESKIDTEHFLLALLSQSEERVIKVLQNLGVSPTQLRNQVFGKLKQTHQTASQPISTSANSSGTNPNNAQLAMIDKILEHPEGSEAEVVKNNPGIIDPKLIGTMAAMLEKRGETKGAKVLRGLIAPRTEETADRSEVPVVVPQPVQKSTPPEDQATKSEPMEFPVSPEDFEPVSTLLEVQAMEPELMELLPPSNQDMENFPRQLLTESFVNKGDKQAVHNFLGENLDKLNDRFPEALQNWFHQTFPNVGDVRKQEFLKRVTNISDLIRTFDGGVRGIHLEIALTGYNIVASILTPTETPKDWADIQNCLGLSYLELLQGERHENLQKAIACFDMALNFYKKEECPELQNIRENAKKARTELRNIKEESAARHRFGHG